jgi:hypothetical protein
MLKNPSKYEQRHSIRPNSSFPLQIPAALILDDSAGGTARELWWVNYELSPVNIIPPWFAMLIYHLGDEQ